MLLLLIELVQMLGTSANVIGSCGLCTRTYMQWCGSGIGAGGDQSNGPICRTSPGVIFGALRRPTNRKLSGQIRPTDAAAIQKSTLVARTVAAIVFRRVA